MEKYFSHNVCWPSNSHCARKIFVKVRPCEETIILLFPYCVRYCVRPNAFISNHLDLGSHNRDNTYSNIKSK